MDALHAIEFIADRLNGNRSIDWNDFNQHKYYFYYDVVSKKFFQTCTHNDIILNAIYCLDNRFLDTVVATVGLAKLKELYIK